MSMSVLEEQRRYYAERAPESDDWWFKRGRCAPDRRVTRNGNILYGGGS